MNSGFPRQTNFAYKQKLIYGERTKNTADKQHVVAVDSILACENIRFSSLFAAGDVSRGGTSVTQRQTFHTDDVKSVRNQVRSAGWSTEQLHRFSYCLRMTVLTDKRQKATEVKYKCEESLTKQSIFVEYSLLQKKYLSFATKIDHRKHKIGQIYIWNPMTTRFIMFILLHEKFLQFDWLRGVVFQLNLKYLHVKVTTFCGQQYKQIIA